MIADTGFTLLLFSLCISLFLASYNFVPRLRKTGLIKIFALSVNTVFVCITLSLASLIYSYAVSDFSVLNVYLNSHTAKPLIYKITGTWGNHEGSMLLFVWLISLFNFLFQFLSKYEGKKEILSFQSLILLLFSSFLIFASNPFERIFPTPENGLGLNPILQDIGLAIHPPILYIGYTGLSIILSFAVTALLNGKFGNDWARHCMPWLLASWGFLTFGIGLGSWWAYRELGWGGFWFWDPVENSSLLPWLSALALFHSIYVLEKRKALATWVLFLSILTFTLSMLGFFLVRSGILTSVHSFANDPARGLFILLIITIVSGYAFLLFGLRSHKFKTDVSFSLVSREGSILFNNLFIITLLAIVALGTLYPIILQQFTGASVSVGAPYYNITFNVVAMVLLVIAGIGPILKWQNDEILKNYKKFVLSDVLSILAAIYVFWLQGYKFTFSLFGIYCSVWLIVAVVVWSKIYTLKKFPSSHYGVFLSHLGIGLLAFSISILSGWKQEKELVMKKGENVEIAGYNLLFKNAITGVKSNYVYRQGEFSVNKGNREVAILFPQTRFFPVEGSQTTETAIYSNPISDIYIVIGSSFNPKDASNGYAVRVYYKPAINLIWLSCLLIGAGGITSAIIRFKKTL